MFRRTIESNLKNWKVSQARKPLILRGARQVGKTSVIRKFAVENFDDFVEINLEKKEQARVFAGTVSVEDFEKRVEIFYKKRLVEDKSLLFIDEIQESKDLLDLMRFFSEEKPQLHFIAAGSLLEAKMGRKWSVPVGRIEYMYLYPMTFFEYLDAVGESNLLDESLSEAAKSLLEERMSDYLIIGGMPEAVSTYTSTKSLLEVGKIHERILATYKEDIGKYASPSDVKYLEHVAENAPKIAGSVFKYENFAGSEYRSREIGEAVRLLQKVMLAKEIQAVNSLEFPITYKPKRAKKMIFLDVGIANHTNMVSLDILKGNYQGKIMEQFVGQTLIARGIRQKAELGYWARNKDEGSAEVDFCFQYRSKIVGLEVKSGNSRSLKSLFSMIDIGGDRVFPVRVSWDSLGIEEYNHNGKSYKILSVPFYLLDKLDGFLDPIVYNDGFKVR